jgi:hypothetical protein
MHFSSAMLLLLASTFALTSALPQARFTTSTKNQTSIPSAAVNSTQIGCPAKGHRQFQPYLRTIGDPSTSPSRFHISENTAGNRTEQILTFSNIPGTAANLSLQWAVSEPPRTFTANGSATAEVHLLDASVLNLGNLTKNNVDAAASPTTIGQAAFDFWPDSTTQSTHLVSSKRIPPAQEISFRVRLLLGMAGDVVIEQNEENGWLLSYDC